MDWFALPPVPGEVADPADLRPPEGEDDRDRRLRQARRGSSARPSTARRNAARRCRSSTTSSASRRRSTRRQARALHEPRASRRRPTPSTRRRRRRYYRTALAARVLPAERGRPALLPRQRRGGPRSLAVGRLLRRRHAEVEPGPGQRRGAEAARDGKLVKSCPQLASRRVANGQYVAYTFYRVDPAWRRLPGRGARGRQGRVRRGRRVVGGADGRPARLHVHRRPARLRLLPLEDHRALRRPRRARRRAERDAARRLARDAVLVPRDDEGVAVHERAARRGRSPRTTSRTSSSTRS